MPTITNPQPITASTFSAYWITQLVLSSQPGKPTSLVATLAPSDGTHLLATSLRSYTAADIDEVAKSDSGLASALADLRAEVARLAIPGAGAELHLVQVNSNDPAKPVRAQVIYRGSDGKFLSPFFVIPDCFALAARDTQFAGVFQTMLATVARLAGLTLSQG